MARRKELRYLTFEILDGFDGSGAVNDAGLAAASTDMDVDTLVLADGRTIVPVGAQFTTAGIATLRTVTASNNSQVWTYALGGATGGTFVLTLNSESTSSLAYDAAAATIQTALEALASVTAGDVTVTGSVGGPFTITMAGDLANIATNTLTDTDSTSGGTGTVITALQDGTTTWNITFTPAIATGSVPANDAVITFYPRKLEAKVGEGNIEHTKNKDPQIDLDRGSLDGARAGNEQPMDVSFSFVYDWLRSSTTNTPTVDEVLEQEGEASDWLTAAADPCEPYQVTLRIIDSPPCGSELAEVILYKYFMPKTVNASVSAAAVSVTGVCVATKPVVYRVTNDADVYGIKYQ